MKVYVACKPCADPYYQGHPLGVCFLSEKEAKKYIDKINEQFLNCPDFGNIAYYYQECSVSDAPDQPKVKLSLANLFSFLSKK
jgi:hypothetical protein